MLKWLLAAVLSLFFIIVWIVFIDRNETLDKKIFDALAPYITAGRTNFMKAVSFFGNHKFLIPANFLLVGYLISRKNKWEAITAAAVSLSSLGLMSLLKNLIHRHRPADPLVEGILNFSFPSGHSFMGVVFYGLLMWWTLLHIKNKWQKRAIISFLLLLLLVIGFSRIYLRVHYTTDVIAGFCIGTAWLIISLSIMYRLQKKYAAVKK